MLTVNTWAVQQSSCCVD